MEKIISSQKLLLDEIIATAAIKYYDENNQKDNFHFDVLESCKEQWLLSAVNKCDLCYDRPSIGFTYSLWYHAKRVNTFLKYLITQLSKVTEPSVTFFDLGAGSGAIQWAIGIVYSAMKNAGIKTPSITIVNVDTSPFMLDYSQNYLWPIFLEKFPCCEELEIQYRVNSWINNESSTKSNVWIAASYLFDNSESKNQVGNDFNEIVSFFEPNRILLTTSYNKREYLASVAASLKDSYLLSSEALTAPVFNGLMGKVNTFRKTLNEEIIQKLQIPSQSSPFRNEARWDMDSLSGVILAKRQQKLGLVYDNLALYNAPFQRSFVQLNKKQQDAATHKNKPTKIIGPAGCGKSVVITERIKDLIIQGKYSPSLKILVTTFNKDLIKCLGDWLSQILDPTKIRRVPVGAKESQFYFENDPKPSLYLYHFDILPTRIGKLKGDVRKGIDGLSGEEIHYHLMKQALQSFENEDFYNDIIEFATPSFLLDEFHRIYYGYNIKSISQYQTQRRSGRGTPVLLHNSNKRELIYKIIVQYLEILQLRQYESFTTMRMKLLSLLELGSLPEEQKFTHIFVDELQDCTYSDYQIFYRLLRKGNHHNIVFGGDLAQSIQLGTSVFIPKSEDVTMGRWENHFLEGSYRLPFRISEGMHELSKQINTRFGKREGLEVSIISPYRGAPPGARVIFVYADTEGQMVQKLKNIYEDYKTFFKQKSAPVTVYEKDHAIVTGLRQVGLIAEDDCILRSKGMEKEMVFWSTRTVIERENEVYEFIYTILTRTSCLLIIGLSTNTLPVYKRIINTFRRDRIILWDEDTKKNFEAYCEKIDVNPIVEEN